MAVHVIKAPAGSGKTCVFAERVAGCNLPAEVYVPTHALATEWRDSVLKANHHTRVSIIRGRDYEVQPSVFLCPRQAHANALIKAGLSVYPNLCLRRPGRGQQPITCPHYHQCGYISQFGRTEVHIFTHAHLPLDRGMLDENIPALVVIDESFHKNLIEDITVPLSLLTHPSLPPVAQRLCHDVAAALRSGAPLKARFAAAIGPRGEFNAAIAALDTHPALFPTQTNAMQRAVLATRINFKPVILLLKQLAREMTVRAVPQSITADAAGEFVLHHKREIARFTRSDGTQPDIFILDASADQQIVQQFFRGVKLTAMALPRNARIVQCHSTRCSTRSLVPAKNTNPKSKADAQQRLHDVERFVHKLATGGTKVLVVGPASIAGNPRTGAQPLLSVPPWCELAHFNALRGIDRWKGFDVVVVIGRNEPPVIAVENMARALFLMDPKRLQLTGRWQYEVRGYRLATGTLGVDVAVHPDRRVQAVVEQIRECESLQAVDRIRLVHSTTTKIVILLSNLVLDIDVDDMGAFREAVANALVHRDYHRLGAVHVRLDDDGLTISNPGGLVDGVTLANLLTTEPRPRNRALADAMKRVGVVERSGRGVDKIYRGMLRFGRPQPDYRRTDAQSVVLRLATVDADEAFLKLVVEEERRRGRDLPIDSLIALAALRELKRLTTDELAAHIQRDAAQARRTLEALLEAGLVQAHGATRGRTYTLAPGVYRADGDKAAYTRQAGFSALQHEQLVLNYARQHGSIRRAEVIELCRLTAPQARDLLRRLKTAGHLVQHGERRGAHYTPAETPAG